MEWIMTWWWPQHGTTGPAASATENEESPDLDDNADAPGPPKSQSVKPMSIDVKTCPSDPEHPDHEASVRGEGTDSFPDLSKWSWSVWDTRPTSEQKLPRFVKKSSNIRDTRQTSVPDISFKEVASPRRPEPGTTEPATSATERRIPSPPRTTLMRRATEVPEHGAGVHRREDLSK